MAPSFSNTDKFQTQVFLFKSMFLLIHLMLQILVLSLMLLLLILVNNKKKEENVWVELLLLKFMGCKTSLLDKICCRCWWKGNVGKMKSL
jgi:hypothetical protein